MNYEQIVATGATGKYQRGTFTQGMATYPCYLIEFKGGYINTSYWMKPNDLKGVKRFIEKYKFSGVAKPEKR